MGEGLKTVVWSDDGVIEATEPDGNSCLLAVQWHPELSAFTDPTQQRHVDWLIRNTAGRRGIFTKGQINHE